jgi:hypothetical protein
MKAKNFVNIILGISTEIIYSLSILLAAFLTCLLLLAGKK